VVRRGTTIIEMLLVVGLTAMVIGTLTLLYGFTFSRIAHSTAGFAATDQARKALDEIAGTAAEAIECTVEVSGTNKALKCTMPTSGTDVDGDGYLDVYIPSTVSRRGLGKYTPGKRIWYYLSNSTGAFTTSGTILWRAQRTDDGTPTGSDADKNALGSSHPSPPPSIPPREQPRSRSAPPLSFGPAKRRERKSANGERIA
jgi:hypothetical protein